MEEVSMQDTNVLSGGGSPADFDMRSWQGLTKVLQAGREANMDAETYAEFRDSVLRYAQSGGTDTELRKHIEELLPEFKDLAPESPKKPQESSQKKETPSAPTSKSDAPIPHNLPTGDEGATRAPQTPVPTPKPKPIPQPEPPQAPVSVPVPKPIPEVTSLDEKLISVDEAKERIAEIKHAVTEYVGNPVTLVSENETVGRAYMQSLLAALKAVSGNAPGTLMKSMKNLEDAYRQVVALKSSQPEAQPLEKPEPPVSQPETPKPEPKQPPTPVSVPAPKPQSASASERQPVEEKKRIPVVEQEELKPEKKELEIPVVSPAKIASLDEHIQKAKESVARAQSSLEKREEKKERTQEETGTKKFPQVTSVVTKKEAFEKKLQSGSHVSTHRPRVEERKEQPKQEKPKEQEESRETKLFEKQVVPKKPFVTPDLEGGDSTEVPKGVSDDLFAAEIEEGLAQLLSEWSIFKGEKKLFGKGPAGREHPLYEKLKNTIMFDVISGHFEGSQKDVVLSIRDYANAWRNEQGVVYSPSETFEHYLRRVIRRIIKRSR